MAARHPRVVEDLRRLLTELPSVEQDITESVAEALKIILAAETLERVRAAPR